MSATNLVKVPLRRVVLIGENIELRIVSLVVRCREVAEEVVLFDTGSTDETVQLAEEVQSQVVHYDGEHTPQALARATKAASLDDGLTLFLPVESTWKLASLPLSVNRAREGWDIHYLYRSERSANDEAPQPIAQSSMGHLITSSLGLEHLAVLPDDATMDDVSDEVRARFIKTDSPIQLLSGNRWQPPPVLPNFSTGCWSQSTRCCCSVFPAWCCSFWATVCRAISQPCSRN